MHQELIIIGAGPAGISMAVEAILSGIDRHNILVLEKSEAHSWSIRKFYPEQKLVTANYKGNAALCKGVMCIPDSSKMETLSYLSKAIKDYQINVSYQESVYKIEKQRDGSFKICTDKREYVAKTCAIAIGMMGKPNRPNYPIPSGVRPQVTYDITSKSIKDMNVLVVGGGDSASEYAQYLSQEGNRVTLCYRRREFSRMNDINLQSLLALEKQNLVRILLECDVDCLEPGERGKVRVAFKEEKHPAQSFDHIVLALGGSTPKNFLKLLGIVFDGDQPVVKDGFETSVPGLFLIGDLSAGRKGGSIITAFNSAHDAMRKICTDYLSCKI